MQAKNLNNMDSRNMENRSHYEQFCEYVQDLVAGVDINPAANYVCQTCGQPYARIQLHTARYGTYLEVAVATGSSAVEFVPAFRLTYPLADGTHEFTHAPYRRAELDKTGSACLDTATADCQCGKQRHRVTEAAARLDALDALTDEDALPLTFAKAPTRNAYMAHFDGERVAKFRRDLAQRAART